MEQFKDAHYFHLPSQGNIYTVADLNLANGSKKLLVASLKREIFCLEYQDSNTEFLSPTIKEVSFTYIPSGAEIISIDAFNKSLTKNEFVVGITIIKNSNEMDSLETFLNIYSEWEDSDDFNIENIAQNCLNVELNYIPYKLLHTYLVTWLEDKILSKEIVFVLSGSDHQVHVYREHTSDHIYKELDNKDYFPEFTKTPSPVVWIDFYFSKDYSERITAIACECGYVKLCKVCTKTNKLVFNFSVRFTNYISKVYLFSDNYYKENTFSSKLLTVNDKKNQEELLILNLVVLNSVLPGVIYHDILRFGLSNYFTLPRLDSGSILTSCEVADVDFDGKKEILIGNSAEEIMLLKFNQDKGFWCLDELKKMAAPIICLKYIDICGEGSKQLVVLSMKGIHVLQHNIGFIQKILEEKVQCLTIPNVDSLKL